LSCFVLTSLLRNTRNCGGGGGSSKTHTHKNRHVRTFFGGFLPDTRRFHFLILTSTPATHTRRHRQGHGPGLRTRSWSSVLGSAFFGSFQGPGCKLSSKFHKNPLTPPPHMGHPITPTGCRLQAAGCPTLPTECSGPARWAQRVGRSS
jgi:hypothetical protein